MSDISPPLDRPNPPLDRDAKDRPSAGRARSRHAVLAGSRPGRVDVTGRQATLVGQTASSSVSTRTGRHSPTAFGRNFSDTSRPLRWEVRPEGRSDDLYTRSVCQRRLPLKVLETRRGGNQKEMAFSVGVGRRQTPTPTGQFTITEIIPSPSHTASTVLRIPAECLLPAATPLHGRPPARSVSTAPTNPASWAGPQPQISHGCVQISNHYVRLLAPGNTRQRTPLIRIHSPLIGHTESHVCVAIRRGHSNNV